MYFQRSILRRSYLALGQSALTARNDVQVRVALVLMVIIALSAGASIVWVSACYALSEIGGLVYLLRLSKRLGHFEQPFSAHFLHEIVLSSLPFFAVGALIEIYGNVDTAMLRYFGGNHEVAYYGAALRLKGIGLMLIPVMHASVQPVLSRLWKHDRAAFRTMVSNWMRILLAISLPMTLGMMAVPDLISDLLFGSEFQASHRTISYLAPVLSLTYLNVLMGSCLSISSDGKSFLKITALSVVINILLNLVMIPFGDSLWGEGGGPAGSSLATVISEIFVLVSMRRIFREGLDHGQLRWNMIYLLIPCLALGLAYPWLPWINPWARLALMLSLTPIYMALTHIARPAEIRHALSLLRKH
jgi:O-antigen/teichoic acid export membrane protein